jgi:adenylate cyclase
LTRRIRLISGLIMFSYLISHFTNHMLGLVSLDAMEAWLQFVYPFWANPLVSSALYGAFAAHFGLALWALWQRRTLRMPAAMAVQYALGFTVPLLALQHVTLTRIAELHGADRGYYTGVLVALFHGNPLHGGLQALLLVIAWTHACIGLRYRLRLEPWYDRLQPLLYPLALLVPVLALLGYAEGGREVLERIAREPNFLEQAADGRPGPEAQARLADIVDWGRAFILGSIAAVLCGRQLRRWWQSRHGLVRHRLSRRPVDRRGAGHEHPGGEPDAAHSACFGLRRQGPLLHLPRQGPREIVALPDPGGDEAAVLRRVGAPPNVRLACQLRPRGDIEAVPLLPPFVHPREGFRRSGNVLGSEQEIAILFADLRAFTRLAETKLPYDVVFLLNRYFAAMGHAIEEAGGRVDKFIGDGIMALFGIDQGPEAGCRHALEAARLMSLRLDDLNRALEHEIESPLRIGIGIHVGPVIVGEMGYGPATQLTAVGDAVNTASRLETLSKEFACELVVSDDVAAKAGIDMTASRCTRSRSAGAGSRWASARSGTATCWPRRGRVGDRAQVDRAKYADAYISSGITVVAVRFRVRQTSLSPHIAHSPCPRVTSITRSTTTSACFGIDVARRRDAGALRTALDQQLGACDVDT